MSTIETAEAILAKADHLGITYRRALRQNPGWKKGRRPGPRPDVDMFILEARNRVLAGRTLSHSEKAEIDCQLLVDSNGERSKKLYRWHSSYAYRQMCWQENWDNYREAEKVARMIKLGAIPERSVLQKRGISRRRFDDLLPLALSCRPRPKNR